ncbi:MAG TPA: MgtC/SapB family protein [Clostridiales bacterium]|nr:MgtC/SapB family protein [Clostridiales bacterium]
MERGMKNRPAGLRTYMLVTLGACVVMVTNQYIYQVFDTGDPVRLGAQVVSGIGFLGAGTIIVTGRNKIRGLTTAAGLWATATVGLAIGIGFYEVALLAGLLVFLVLTVLHKWETYMRRAGNRVELYIELKPGATLREFLDVAREYKLDVSGIHPEADSAEEVGASSFFVSLKGRRQVRHGDIINIVRKMDIVAYIEEM